MQALHEIMGRAAHDCSLKGKMHRVGLDFVGANFETLLGISNQTAGPICNLTM
jgi:hypothetical protein